MREIFFNVFFLFFVVNLYSQAEYSSKYELLDDAKRELNYPELNLLLDTLSYNENDRLIEQWNKSNEYYAKDLSIFSYKDYIKVIKSKYPLKPKYINSGNPKQDEQNYKLRLNKWVENHPDYPQYLDTGNPSVDKEKLRKARLRFYIKYIKED